MKLCNNCLKPIFPRDEDAGTYKEYFCSKSCEIEAENNMDQFFQKQKQTNLKGDRHVNSNSNVQFQRQTNEIQERIK